MKLDLTPVGRELLMQALVGTEINFIGVQLGNGANAGPDATALSNPLLSADISSYSIDANFIALHCLYNNSLVDSSFRATELGIFVRDPEVENGTLLYAYGYATPEQADYVPAGEEVVLETQLDIMVYIGDAENVTASISESLIYATKEELNDHIRNNSNPHATSKEQVGLGNVPNVTTNDQTPTYSEYTTLHSFENLTDEDSAPEMIGARTQLYLGHLVSGEKLSAVLSKLQSAVKLLIRHLSNYANPHVVTWKQAGAAAEVHQHSTSDIISGVLGLARGGTGNAEGIAPQARKLATARSLKVNLASSAGQSFDGSADAANIGVSGTLPIAGGGTGVTTIEALRALIGVGAKPATIVIGTSTAGWTAAECDYLCDGTDDQVEINQALAALPAGGGAVLLLNGTYNISGDITISKDNSELRGMSGTIINSSTAGESWVIAYRIKITANKCIVRNLVLVGPQSSASTSNVDNTALIQVVNSDRSVVEGNRIVRGTISLNTCTNTIVSGNIIGESNGYAKGITTADGSGNQILGNNLTGAYVGVAASRESKFLIQGNVTTLQQNYGIAVSNNCKDFTISGNSLHTSQGGTSVGISVGWARNYTVSGNSVSVVDCDWNSDCIQVGGVNFIVTGNFVKSNTVSTPIKVFANNSANGLIALNGLTCKNEATMGVFINATATNCTAVNNLVQAFDDAND